MAFDAFMVIKDSDGKTLEGESTDLDFAKKNASDILKFSFSSSDALDAIQRMRKEEAENEEIARIRSIRSDKMRNPSEDRERFIGPALPKDLKKPKDQESLAERQKQWIKNILSAREEEKKSRLSVGLEKYLDKASSGLLEAYCRTSDGRPAERKPFKSVTLYFRKAGGATPLLYLRIKLFQVSVSSYNLESGDGNSPPKESLTFSFETFVVQHTSQTGQGAATGKSKTTLMGWDYDKNTTDLDTLGQDLQRLFEM
jgi:type VI protein secretion system component Hcp